MSEGNHDFRYGMKGYPSIRLVGLYRIEAFDTEIHDPQPFPYLSYVPNGERCPFAHAPFQIEESKHPLPLTFRVLDEPASTPSNSKRESLLVHLASTLTLM